MNGTALAEQLFDAQSLMLRLEDVLYDRLCADAGIDGNAFTDWSYDSYDSSIEFHGCEPALRLTESQQNALWGLGFDRCWLNHTNNTETYYFKDGSVDGSRTVRQ